MEIEQTSINNEQSQAQKKYIRAYVIALVLMGVAFVVQVKAFLVGISPSPAASIYEEADITRTIARYFNGAAILPLIVYIIFLYIGWGRHRENMMKFIALTVISCIAPVPFILFYLLVMALSP